ncbi:CaiB/BaiF CoA transferase family protein [Saccharopolyspora sp. 5N102]|uniref:CaiB/BaiF CoA transferase family protein n=1 Tax=Saccharopolyspora sp. 5N102 TaxID=3375155 RepID=UPI0037B06298
MTKPLEGMLVVSLEQAVAAPLATCRLADSGARVIKIERTSGDFARGYDRAVQGESAYFVWLNRGKESICLDFTREEDAALLRAMISRADVFVQNLGPGAAARAGLEAESLVEANPRLVACTISGYGRTGPYAQMKAYDLLIQAESGLASITGTPEAPGRVGVSACDIAAGLSAHAGIVEALLRRATTGSGGVVDVSMFAAMAEWMAVPLLHWEHQRTIWPRVGLNHPVIAPYGAYPTAGEGMVLVGIQNDVQWRRFAERLLDRPELAGDERYATNVERVAHRAEIDGLVEGFLAPLTADEAVARLVQVDIPCARINGVPELAAHPQLSRLGVDTPAGTVSVTAPPTQHSTWSLQSASVPALDQHGAALREEFATTKAP